MSEHGTESSNFIRDIVAADVKAGKYGGRVVTRFPPEPNGFLHIGHAKSICLNFGIAREFGGVTFLRMDDTNPTTEDEKYVRSIQEAVRWLGFDWGDRMRYASDYFEQLFEWAVKLIRQGDAYVCSLSEEQMREYRGTVTEPGRESPYRTRSVEENLDLFHRMRAGEFPDGAHTLRAKIDMAHPNMKLRDPPLYRIRRAHHYRTGDAWVIYPLYDFAHCLSDAIEGITHSLCTLEFENNRPLYDWIIEKVGFEHPPRQYEFARLSLTRTVMSKRRLKALVEEGVVSGWDDPRLPTLLGVRRRGYTPAAIRAFCEEIGVAKANSVIELERLEAAVRADLEVKAPRAMAVLDPLRLVVENYPEDKEETFEIGERKVPFSRVVLVERGDFAEVPPKGWRRLSPGAEVRLRHAYLVTCREVVKDEKGEVVELRCTYDEGSRGGQAPDGRKVRGTLHWVSEKHALDAEVRLYDDLFTTDEPSDEEWREQLNPDSLEVVTARVEPSLASMKPGEHVQFERNGFFVVDQDSRPGALVFNRTVTLRDSFAKQQQPVEAPQPVARPEPKVTGPSFEERLAKLPADVQARFRGLEEKGLSREDAMVLAQDDALRQVFDDASRVYDAPRSLVRWVANELPRLTKDPAGVDGAKVAALAKLVDDGQISGTAAKEVFEEVVKTGAAPSEIIEKRGLGQLDASALGALVDEVLSKHANEVQRYRDGAKNLLGFFVGQVMKASSGRADAKAVREALQSRLG